MKFTYISIALYALGFALLFGALMYVTYYPPAKGGDTLVAWIYTTLGTLSGHILTLIDPTKPNSAVAPDIAPLPVAARGFARIGQMLVLTLVGLLVVTLSGCASLQDAGHTAYSMKPVIGADGKATSCEFNATDGKEYASRSISVNVGADGCTAIVREGASSAFQGQAIAEKGLSVLPSFAPLVLPPGPASAPILPAMQ